MVKNFTFRGLMAPVFTAFNNDSAQTINLNVIPAYSKFLADSNIMGILVNGTSGEGMSLTVDEREKLTESWAKACSANKQCLMVQVGGTVLPDVTRLAKHAESLNVDALLCLPELYSKPKTVTELIDYLKLVSKAAPNTPLFYYHIPLWTNVTINMAEFLNAAYKEIPTLKGIKFTSTNLDEGSACLNAGDGSYVIFLGADQIMLGAFALGFDSAIATTFNMIPQKGHQIWEQFTKKKLDDAKCTQHTLTSSINAIVKNGSWVSTMKTAMNILTPIQVGDVRPPLKQLSENEKQEMKNDLKQL